MLNKVTILIFCLGTLVFNACGDESKAANSKSIEKVRETFPRYEEVLVYLSEAIDRGGKDCRFEVAKKADGYFLMIYAADGDYELLDEKKIWDAQSEKFIEPKVEDILRDYASYFPNESLSEAEMKKRLATSDVAGFKGLYNRAKSFDFNLFYGYQDWAQDVIDAIEPIEKTTNLEKELLARAYDNLASDYIHPGQYGQRSAFASDFKESNYDKVDQDRIDQFLVMAQKSLGYYDQIIEDDPQYDSYIIGNVQLKRANNCMHYWLLMNSVLEYELADQFIKDAKYRDGDIDAAKVYLSNCTQDALLISNGDNDTYPLWYVQESLGFRGDIKVINSSLLAAPWYPRMIVDKTRLKSVMCKSNYHNTKLAYILLEEGSDNVVAFLNDVKAKTKNLEEVMLHMPYGTGMSLDFDSSVVALKISPSYLFLNELLLLDFIQSNSELDVFVSNRGTFKKFGLENRFYEGLMLSKFDKRNFFDIHPRDQFNLLTSADFDLLFNGKVNLKENTGRLILSQYYRYLTSLDGDKEGERAKELKRFNDKFKLKDFFERDYMGALNIVFLIGLQNEEGYQKEVLEDLLRFLAEMRVEFENEPQNVADNFYDIATISNIYRALKYEKSPKFEIDKETDKGIEIELDKEIDELKKMVSRLIKLDEIKPLKWTVERLQGVFDRLSVINVKSNLLKAH